MSTWNQWEWSPEIDFQSRSGLVLKKFCDNLEVYSAYRNWELIPANELFAHYLKITNQIYSEGEKTSHRLQEAFGEDPIDRFS